MDTNTTIFLLDDDQAVRDALGVCLECYGFTVVAFESAELFLEQTRENMRGILVVDQRMPEMSGLELLAELRSREIELPIIIITGHGDSQMSAMARKQGAVGFLEKPFRNQDLLECIENIMKNKKPFS
ncbi:MAG: response regulator [Gammaproteobacteria bacterium]|nr:response regulator [Gammaproteobacteria bacterium]